MKEFIFRIGGSSFDYDLTVTANDRFEAFEKAVDYCKKHPTEMVTSIYLMEE